LEENTDKPKQNSGLFTEDLPDELKLFIELSDDLIFQLDFSGNILAINKNGALLLDYKQEELTGKYFFDLIKPSSRNFALNASKETLSDFKIKTLEVPLYNRNKDEIIFRFKIKAVKVNENITLAGVGKNLSFIKKLESKIWELNETLKETKRILQIERSRGVQKISVLEELNRMKAEFISNISHEFRTPLSSIIGFSESLITDTSMTQEHQREFIQIILDEGKKLARLINEVLDITRLETGEIGLNKTKFKIIPLLNKVVEKLNSEIIKKELIFTKELPEDEIFIYGDKEKLEQAFYSVLENAVKYTGRGGRISLFIQNLYREFEVIITDTGIGISPKILPGIFQKYYNDTNSGDYDSKRGLGLVFVKHIMDLHKGSITIQSELNQGTTVIIKLLKEE